MPFEGIEPSDRRQDINILRRYCTQIEASWKLVHEPRNRMTERVDRRRFPRTLKTGPRFRFAKRPIRSDVRSAGTDEIHRNSSMTESDWNFCLERHRRSQSVYSLSYRTEMPINPSTSTNDNFLIEALAIKTTTSRHVMSRNVTSAAETTMADDDLVE